MVQNETINTTQDYVNYTFNIETRGASLVAGELIGLSNTVNNILGDIAFKTSELLSYTETIAIGASAAIGGAFISAAQSAVHFEQQMANVKAIGGESLNASEIGNAAMEYSNKFGMATASMTEGLEALARAGITTTSVMQGVLEEGVKLSTLEGIDLEDSINDLISTTNLLASDDVDMNSPEYAEMVKTMNQHIVSTSESAPINAQNIIQSLQHVGGYASASGIDQDDLFAVIAQLGARGTKGEMAGTALRAFVAAGQKDTAQRALARIGLNVSDLWDDNGEAMLSISEMKDVLDEAMENKGYSKQEKLEFYSDFAGYKQANQIMKIDTSEVEQYKENIASAWDLGHKLDTILGTVRGNIDRIFQITQNFMTKVGSKILIAANAILTPVRLLLEFITKIPFADTAFAVGMISIGFVGVLKVVNNIVPRFASFFIELSRSRQTVSDIRNIWRQIPDDIDRAKKTLKAMSKPEDMLNIQRKYQLYSKKDMEAIEDKVARVFYVEANWDDPRVADLNKQERAEYLNKTYDSKDDIFKQDFINNLKIHNPDEWTKQVGKYLQNTTEHARNVVAKTSYDIDLVKANGFLSDIDKYVGWIWGAIRASRGVKDNRERNAEEQGGPTFNTENERQGGSTSNTGNGRQSSQGHSAEDRRRDFDNIKRDILGNASDYGDYSYRVNPSINMPQFDFNDVAAMQDFEAQVIEQIRQKEGMFIDFLNDKTIEAGRTRLKKSLTAAAKSDLGYEFSTGANTSDIKKILQTGQIRSGSSHITNEQLEDIASVLGTNVTGDTNNDMVRFYNILKRKSNKDVLLDEILQKTQQRWNDTYYNNGKVGFFPTKALENASNGETARKIMQKVGVNSIEDVQEHFKNVALDDTLLNECVDIMYEDRELVKTLVDSEIEYMYQNLVRVQNSIRNKTQGNSGFASKGEEYQTNLQKARDYVLSDFNPRDFANFSPSPRSSIYDLSTAIETQNDDILHGKHGGEHLQGFQGYIYPIGTDIAQSQRYGNDNFKIVNIKHLPYNDLLKENVEKVFLDRDINGEKFDFMETFADWVYEEAPEEGNYWHNAFDYEYAQIYHEDTGSGFADSAEVFDELKLELEEIYRAYIDLCAYGAQSLIESSKLSGPTVSFRGGRFYTPENSFGAFDTITSTSLQWQVAKNFWSQNQTRNKILEIYNPEGIPGIIAHTDLLNNQNNHLWSKERELTLAKGQPYLHIPNPDNFEKRLLMLTADQQKAVKEIMGEDFEFTKNSPSSAFLSAGDEGGVRVLKNTVPRPINKDILTKENLSEKIQDFFTNGSVIVGSKGYGQGFLGEADGKGTIDIRPGVIKYYSDKDSETWGEYGNALLDTVIHEMTHTLMMHTERQDYKNNDIPAELGIDNFEIPQQLLGYRSDFVAEYEAQYVTNQVFKRLGLEVNKKNQQRMNAFEDLIKHKGYGDQIQYELLDQLAEDMLANISTIGDITESLSTQWNMAEANVTSGQISEDMRPILTKIQAFDKDMIPYQGSNLDSKKDKVEQVLSNMETDMELLWSSGISDKELIYNMVAQKYAPYIETLEGVNLNQFLKHASPTFANKGGNDLNNIIQSLINEYGAEQVQKAINNMNVLSSTPKNDNITDIILDSWNHLKTKTDGKLPLDMFYNYIEETYGKEASDEAQKWIDDASQNVKGLLTNKNTGLSKNKKLLPEVIDKWNDKRKQVDHYEYIHLPDANIMFPLPVHKEFAENGYTLHTKGKQKGQIDRSVAQKYVHKNSAKDARSFLGIVDLLDTDFVRNLSKNDQSTLWNAIQKGENAHFDINSLIDSDNKLGKGWAALNVTTAMDCMGRLEDGSCQFCDACYAFGQAARLPEQAVKQVAKSALFASTSAEEFADIINQNKISIVRFNQEGDFRDLDDYLKTAQIAKMSGETQFYGYTKNQEVLDYIEKHGSPDNYQMNNSLDTWETGNYIAASWSEVLEYLEKGYELCYGACEYCQRCLDNINKVTILRDGSQKAGVDEIYAVLKKHEQHIELFRRIAEAEQQGKQITKDFINQTMHDIADTITTSTLDSFRNEGEYTRLPELADYFPIDDSRVDESFIESLGYGGLDKNIREFIGDVDEAFVWEDDYRKKHGKRRRTDNHWGAREIINHGYDGIGSTTDRLLNYGLFYNRKTTGEAKSTGIEEIVNLLNKDATKEAFMQGIISYNQLIKWHKQLQDSLAVARYGDAQWNLEDVEAWKQEKDDADKKIADAIKQRKEKLEILKAQNEIIIATLQILSLMPIEFAKDIQEKIIPDNTVQSTLNVTTGTSNDNTKARQEEFKQAQQDLFDMGHAVRMNEQYKKNQEEFKQAQQDLFTMGKAARMNEQYKKNQEEFKQAQQDLFTMGKSVRMDEQYKKNQEEFKRAQEDLLKMAPKDKYEEKGESFGLKIKDFFSNARTTVFNKIGAFGEKYQDTDKRIEVEKSVGQTTKKLENIIGPLKSFNAGLEKAAQVFPPLSVAVIGLDTGIEILEGVTSGLNALTVLSSEAKLQEAIATLGLTASEETAALAKGISTVATWGLNAAIGVLNFLLTGPVLAAIVAVVAAVELVKFWENKHAEALKESQKALEEATAKNNIALSQYKSLKQARENETDAMKRQQLARKESIALYKLEAARVQQQKAVYDNAKLRGDDVWGEYGLRASMQKMGLGFIAGGDFESQYENYDGTTKNVRQIKESTLGNLFATSEQRQVADFYDSNKMFLANVEAYQDPLQELYDKESKLIEEYGSIDAARGTQEFVDAVQEFADATGINGETAMKMLDWLETENRVEQATQVGQAEIGAIMAKRQAEIMKLQYGDEFGAEGFDDVGNAMVMAQFQEMMNNAKTEVWWDLLFAYLDAILTGLNPLNWVNGELNKKLGIIGVNQDTLAELDAEGNSIYSDMKEAYEEAERRDYGNKSYSYYGDTPFGGALASSAAAHADEQQSQVFADTGQVYTEDEYLAIQDQYQQDNFGVTATELSNKREQERAEEAESFVKQNDSLSQLQENGETAHQDALDIIDAIKNPGIISGLGASLVQLINDELIKEALNDFFAYLRNETGTLTSKAVSAGKKGTEGIRAAYADDGLRGAYTYGKSLVSQGVEKVRGIAPNAVARTENAISKGRGIISSGIGKVTDRIALAREANALAADGVPIARNSFDKAVGAVDDARAAFNTGGLKGLGQYGKGLASQGVEKVRGVAPNAIERAKTAVSRGRGIISSGIGKVTDRIALAREANALAADGVPIARNSFDKAVGAVDDARAAFNTGGLKGLGQYGKGLASQGVEKVRGVAPNAIERAKTAVSRGRGIISSGIGKVTDRIALAREANALAADGVPIARDGFDKAIGAVDDAHNAFKSGGLRGLGEHIRGVAPNAVERAKTAISRGTSAVKGSSAYGKVTDRIALAREANALAADGVPIARDGFDKAIGAVDDAHNAFKSGGLRGLGEHIRGVAPNAVERAKTAISRGTSAVKGSSAYGKVTDRIALAREANALAADGVPVARNGIDKAVGFADSAKAAYVDDGLKGLANFGKEAGKDGAKGLANAGKAAYSATGGIKGIHASAMGEMKSVFSPKMIAGGVDDVAKGLKGGGSLLKGIGKIGGPALAALGPALAFADKASELNPFEGKHYNEDGTEKKALQATGEVVGSTVGAVGGVVGGFEGAAAGAAIGTMILPGIGTAIGGIIGGVAGGWLGDTIFQPIGEAIGGTIGWLGDNLLGGVQDMAGKVWDGLGSAASGVWDAVSGAAGNAWDWLTGANDNSNNPAKGILGWTPLGMGINAVAGIGNALFGGDEEGNRAGGVAGLLGLSEPDWVQQARDEQVFDDFNQSLSGQGTFDNFSGDIKKHQNIKTDNSKTEVHIHTININTDDNPEKIKTALMELIVEFGELATPTQVSRIIGEPPAASSASTEETTEDTENTDNANGENGTNTNGNNNTNPTT